VLEKTKNKQKLRIVLKKRISSGILDLYIFMFSFIFIPLAFVNLLEGFIWILYLIMPVLYFGVVPYATKGFTIGGYILNTKIYFLLKNASIYKYFSRAYQQLSFFFKDEYRTNYLGQNYVDEKFNTIIKISNKQLQVEKTTNSYFFSINNDNLKQYANECKKKLDKIFYLIFIMIILFYIFKRT